MLIKKKGITLTNTKNKNIHKTNNDIINNNLPKNNILTEWIKIANDSENNIRKDYKT